ncbi:Aspartate--tRNA ligase [Diplonema papillatum]|nr:Aspartate--tRNA ligase [Diplonema papillatum]|eukprot:gene43-77_t
MQPSTHLKAKQPMGSEALKQEVEDLRKALEEREKLYELAAKDEADAAAATAAAEKEAQQKPSKKDLKKAEKAAKKGEKQPQGPQIEFDPSTFGPLPLIRSESQTGSVWTRIGDITAASEGKAFRVRARISTSRKASSKLAFIVLRKKLDTIQCVLGGKSGDDTVMRNMIKWVCSLPLESIVDVVGEVVKPVEPVHSTTQSDAELHLTKVFLVSSSLPVLPFQIADAAGLTEGVNVNQDTRLQTRWLDMRTPCNHSIWNLQSRVCQYFREYLLHQSFAEIHSPKIIPVASESGASVFKLGYFGRNAYLAQSPQLYKQMALQGDLERVFEVGPVFRAENANTHRHLCEFVGLDVEMEIKEHYYEVLDLAEGLFTYMFNHLQTDCAPLVDAVQKQWNQTPFEHKMTKETIDKYEIGILNGPGARESKDEFGAFVHNLETATLRMEYPKAIRLLNTELAKGEQMEETEDLNTTNEKHLGRIVKKRYGVDFFIVDWFPADVRPFYTMPHPKDARFSNSYDMFMRGEEISSGAQRIHDVALLEERIQKMGVDSSTLVDYLDSFRLGAWPHGGFGVGMERVLMLYLGLGNIRSCSLFPRDPQRNTP